jgi:hypothetical protein
MLKLILLIAALAATFAPAPTQSPNNGTVIVQGDPQPGCPGPGCKP